MHRKPDSNPSCASCAPSADAGQCIRLRPHPASFWGLAALAALLLVDIAGQLRGGQHWQAALQALLGLAIAFGVAPDLLLLGKDPPRQLSQAGDGMLVLELRSGHRRVLRPAASTLAWGRCLLLVLEDGHGPPLRLVLGPANVPASQLAALRREWIRVRQGLSGPLA